MEYTFNMEQKQNIITYLDAIEEHIKNIREAEHEISVQVGMIREELELKDPDYASIGFLRSIIDGLDKPKDTL